MLFLMPAFLLTLSEGLRTLRERGWRGALGMAAVALGMTVPAVAASSWWVHWSDAVKALNPAGEFLQSASMAPYNFGIGRRFDPALWEYHWIILFREILHPLAVVPALALLVAGGDRRLAGLVGVGLFLGIQVIFPILYAWHEYYYVANAVFLVGAVMTWAIGCLEDRRFPAFLGAALAVVFVLIQAAAYVGYYYPHQRLWSPGATPLAEAVSRVTGPGDGFVIAGDDWSSITPFFSKRRALMIRRSLERNAEFIDRVFRANRGHGFATLVLLGPERGNTMLIAKAGEHFGIDPRPVASVGEADLYVHRSVRSQAVFQAKNSPDWVGLRLYPDVPDDDRDRGQEVLVQDMIPSQRERFSEMTPMPFKVAADFPAVLGTTAPSGRRELFAHPVCRFWFRLEAGRHRLEVEARLDPEAFAERISPTDRTDGVDLLVERIGADGSRHPLGRGFLPPGPLPSNDRFRVFTFDFELEEATEIVFSTAPGPAGNAARDWVTLGRLKIGATGGGQRVSPEIGPQ
jgi:hypothetical protein